MKLTYTVPLTRAHVEILLAFPIEEPLETVPVITITPVGGQVPLVVIRHGTATVNGQLTLSARIIITSPSSSTMLSSVMGPQVGIEFVGFVLGEGASVRSLLQSSKRENTSLTATILS